MKRNPKSIRPMLKEPVASQFRDYCRLNDLVMDSAATVAVQEWLERQPSQTVAPQPIAS